MSSASSTYQPRRPEHGALHQLVRDHVETFRAQAVHMRDGLGLPRCVEQEFREFLPCGCLAAGFARFRCPDCRLDRHTGWNPIARGFFKGHIQALGGGFIPFAKTKAQRVASGDPRLSLEERYGSHDAYVARVKAAAARAVAERFLRPDDAEKLVAQAEKSNVLR